MERQTTTANMDSSPTIQLIETCDKYFIRFRTNSETIGDDQGTSENRYEKYTEMHERKILE